MGRQVPQNMERGDANANCPPDFFMFQNSKHQHDMILFDELKASAYRYKKECSVAFEIICQNAFPAGAQNAPLDH